MKNTQLVLNCNTMHCTMKYLKRNYRKLVIRMHSEQCWPFRMQRHRQCRHFCLAS